MIENARARMLLFTGLGVILLVVSGCNTFTGTPLAGNVSYRERMLLPSGAELNVRLEKVSRLDVSQMDVAAEILAEIQFPIDGTPPYSFVLHYDESVIDPRHRYVVRARISAERQLLFTNMSAVPAFETTPVDIVVNRVSGQSNTVKSDADLENTLWKLVSINDTGTSNGVGVGIGVSGEGRDITLSLDDKGAHGFAGCNQFTGAYQISNANLGIGPLALTRRACAEGMTREAAFMAALEKVVSYSIYGDFLSLRGDDQQQLLQFEALYLQ